MDTKDLIIIAGSIFFVLIVGHGLWVARRARRNEIRMDIQASEGSVAVTTEVPSAELPNGGARVISQALQGDHMQANAGIDDDGPSLVSDAAEGSQNSSVVAAKAPQTQDLFGDTQPLVTENRSTNAGRAQETATSTPAQRSDSRTNPEQEEVAVDRRRQDPQLEELLILGVLAKSDQPFGGEELISALRGQGLKFGDMGIFHRLGDDQGERLTPSVVHFERDDGERARERALDDAGGVGEVSVDVRRRRARVSSRRHRAIETTLEDVRTARRSV